MNTLCQRKRNITFTDKTLQFQNQFIKRSAHRRHYFAVTATRQFGSKHSKLKPKRKMSKSELTIAIEGCCHGELDKIYATIQYLQEVQDIEIDLLICCGDFQAVRNAADLMCLACPPKYRDMNTFYKYYSGKARAPVPTLFIGGNHEAINHLTELYYGGWVAPNIYFLGFSGVVNFGGIRIGGLSGIYTPTHYHWNHSELPPYEMRELRSSYHLREFDVFKLKQLDASKGMDIFLSHDWPAGITQDGDLQDLLRRKPFIRAEIERNEFGSPPAMELMDYLKPDYWFSAHMHTKFSAMRQHKGKGKVPAACTKFLALDKCLPRRQFLQIVRIPGAQGPKIFKYDKEWLAIVHATHNHLNWGLRGSFRQPEELDLIASQYVVKDAFADLTIPQNFQQTAPAYKGEKGIMPEKLPLNPQTTEFLQKLGLENNIGQQSFQFARRQYTTNQEEIDLDLADDDVDEDPPFNEEEIDLSDVDDEGDELSKETEVIRQQQESSYIDEGDMDDIIDVWDDEDDEDNDYEGNYDVSNVENMNELVGDETGFSKVAQVQCTSQIQEKQQQQINDDKQIGREVQQQEEIVENKSDFVKALPQK
eukprot:TRINITY_DN6665_c0_g1_i2.p1 TRINITY_DN6665_c0_g1~~TRINITY_DN6665_c0_g1_i2.p1  ORF type:complete len:591 (-),score=75.62 TRINITY_DN6665_c0_g1_i2:290-2062(-)